MKKLGCKVETTQEAPAKKASQVLSMGGLLDVGQALASLPKEGKKTDIASGSIREAMSHFRPGQQDDS